MIAVFFGGRSCEHDISIITGLQALSACPRRAEPVYIDPDGVWWTGSGFDSVNAVKNKRFKGKRVHVRAGEPYLYCKNKRLFKIDAALLCNHGMLGEDGSLQGLFAMSGIPYTGSGVLASAVGMNKLASKWAFERAGLSVLPYIALTRAEYEKDVTPALKRVKDVLGMPVIVKPCNLGSSIGISVAKTQTEFFTALRVAFEWDEVVIVEKALEGFTEVNCAVLGDASCLGFTAPQKREKREVSAIEQSASGKATVKKKTSAKTKKVADSETDANKDNIKDGESSGVIDEAKTFQIDAKCPQPQELGEAALSAIREAKLTVSETEQPVGWEQFLKFNDKYSGDVKSTRHKIPAEVGDEINEKIKDMAKLAFVAIGCSGVARVDFLVKDGTVYVNEINTIPGSLASPLFSGSLDFPRLIDRLIELAQARQKRDNALKRTYTPVEPIIGSK